MIQKCLSGFWKAFWSFVGIAIRYFYLWIDIYISKTKFVKNTGLPMFPESKSGKFGHIW